MGQGDKLEYYNFSEEDKKRLLSEIQNYFENERDIKIGIIASEQILEFFLNTMGRHIYNKALDDTIYWFKKKMENVEADLYALYKN